MGSQAPLEITSPETKPISWRRTCSACGARGREASSRPTAFTTTSISVISRWLSRLSPEITGMLRSEVPKGTLRTNALLINEKIRCDKILELPRLVAHPMHQGSVQECTWQKEEDTRDCREW